MDGPQPDAGAARLPHPPDRLPGDRDQRRRRNRSSGTRTTSTSRSADANAPPGQVKLLIDFRNPIIVGKFVYHCHILEHEDGGMMAVAEVAPSISAAARALATRVANVVRTALGREAIEDEPERSNAPSGRSTRCSPAAIARPAARRSPA